MKTTRLFSMLLITGVIMTSCADKKVTKNAVGDVSIDIPCSNFKSDKNYFRANQSSNSTDLADSRDNALFAAKRRLAGLIESKIKEVADRYADSRKIAGNSEFSEKIQRESRDIISQELKDINIVCEKTMQKPDGSYNTFIAIECSKETIYNGLNQAISNNQKLRQDYDQMQFKKTFDEEMNKLEAEQP